jgi:hypothetical protein
MANEFARNVQDAGFCPVAFALPSSASASTNSTSVDLGALGTKRPEGVELQIACPLLTITMIPDTKTVTYIIEASSATGFGSDVTTLYSKTITSAGTTAPPVFAGRCSIPSNCPQFVRGKVTLGANTTDSSAVSATFSVRF